MITIVDCDLGNIGSVQNMLKWVGVDSKFSSSESEILAAEKLILPGVGSFDHGMERLCVSGLKPALIHKVLEEKTPILGICLGMQLLMDGSEEGSVSGLGFINGKAKKFDFLENGLNSLKIPHMGWNEIIKQGPCSLFKDLDEANSRFYFVHSFHVSCDDEEDIATLTNYGYAFPSAVEKNNIFGVQFHPEKSHAFGFKLLKNFAEF